VLLAHHAESRVGQSLEAGRVNFLSAPLTKAIGALFETRQRGLHLGQKALGVLQQAQFLGLLKGIGGIVGLMIAVPQVVASVDLKQLDLFDQPSLLIFE
jgi:hypothetical protein